MLIKSTHERISCAKDLPNDHVYGMQVEIDNDMTNIIKNAYDEKKQEHFNDVEKDYKPAMNKYCLKPPKPTKANDTRTKFLLE